MENLVERIAAEMIATGEFSIRNFEFDFSFNLIVGFQAKKLITNLFRVERDVISTCRCITVRFAIKITAVPQKLSLNLSGESLEMRHSCPSTSQHKLC